MRTRDTDRARSYPMTGTTSRPVRTEDADRPIPFFLTDAPLRLVPCSREDRDALAQVP